MVFPLGLLVHLRVLVSLLKLLLVGILLVWLLNGVPLVVALDGYSSSLCAEWGPPDEYDEVEAASLVPDHPNVWFDGSLVLDQVTGVFSSGAGFFAHQSVNLWDNRRWGHVDHVRPEGDVQSCRGFCSVPGPLQSFQRAEMWGVILALQSSGAVHLGVDNLGVVRHVCRLLDGRHSSVPFELVHDGDLVLLIDRMLHLWGLDTVRITKVKGHADEGMVLDGRVREVDRFGNNSADEAADFGRIRVGNAVIDARCNLSGVCGRWYPVILSLHRFSLLFLVLWLIMICVVVLLLTLWFGLPVLIPRGVVWCMRFGTRPFCMGHLVFGIRNGFLCLLLLFALLMFLIGPTHLVFWLSGLLFLVLFIGLLGVLTLVLVVFPMWNCSFCMSFGLVRDSASLPPPRTSNFSVGCSIWSRH